MPHDADFYRALQEKVPHCSPEEFMYLQDLCEDKQELYRALKERAYSCSSKEFRDLLTRFGDDPQALGALQKAVSERSKVEDRGSYCEDATSGWNTYIEKKNLLMDFRLGTGVFKGSFRKAAEKPAEPAEETDMLAEIAALKKRLKELETKARTPKGPKAG